MTLIGYRNTRTRLLRAASGLWLGVAALNGCGAPEDAAGIETARGALIARSTNNFNKNTPKVAEPRQSDAALDAAIRVGYGGDPTRVAEYALPGLANDGGRHPWMRLGPYTVRTAERPSRVWEVPPVAAGGMATVATDITQNRVLDSLLGTVFPQAVGQGLHPVGPPATLSSETTKVVNNILASMATFALMDDGRIFHAYLPTDTWRDFPLATGGGATTPCGSGKAPYTGPQALRRKTNANDHTKDQDSVVFGCGAASPAQACEYRIGGPAHASTFYACFGASTTFADNTRPVGFADAGNSTSPTFGTGERWIFATINSGANRKVVGLRENSSVDGTTQPTYDALKTLDSQPSTATFSSPIPIMYADPATGAKTLGVFYLRTLSGGTTKLMVAKAVSPFSTFTVTTAHDLGLVLPAGNDPEPYILAGMPGVTDQLRVQFRLPVTGNPAEVRDTVDLIQEPDNNWVKTLLPAAYDATNLYVTQDSSGTLYQVDEATGSRTALATGWGGITSFVSDGVGLGYAIKGADLWEINLNDGTGRKLPGSWNGVTNLAFGYDQSFGAGKDLYPRLFAIRSNAVIRIDPATGGATQLTTFANGVKFMATLADPQSTVMEPTIYVIDGAGKLFFVPALTGQQFGISAAGAWSDARALTADAVHKYLYIASGPLVAGGQRLYRLDQGGTVLGNSSTYSNSQWLATVGGTAYLMKSRQLMRVGGTGSSVSLTSLGQIWDYSETGMVGRNY